MNDEQTILEMRDISKTFGGVHALQKVTFTCRRGTVHALLGENGAGKSTLIKILAGAHQADSGEIHYQGASYRSLTARQALDLGIRIIYQERNLIPAMTVMENIFLGHEPRNRWGVIDRKQLRQQTVAILTRLGIALDPATPVEELPVASQQMVEIAKALSEEATLLVMDEPSAILAGDELERLFAIIALLVEQGVTIIYISHRLEEVFRLAQEITVLKDGESMGTHLTHTMSRERLIQLMVGRTMDELFPPKQERVGELALAAHGVRTNALQQPVSLEIRRGEIVGLAGMVGSGRTEVARALFGADPLLAGTIEIGSQQLRAHEPRQAIGAGIALVPEDRKSQGLLIDQPIRHNLTMAVLNRLTRWGVIQRQPENRIITELQETLAIRMASAEQRAEHLSGGNQQKVVLGKWLATEPAVIMLDEPTRGIDVGAKFEIYQLIRDLANQGLGVLIISSELPEILGMADRVLVMQSGRIVGELAGDEASEEAILALATMADVPTDTFVPTQRATVA